MYSDTDALRHTTSFRALQAEGVWDRPCTSYLRFSSLPQERGSTIERQRETLDRVISHFRLREDQTLTDRALSASKGHHRTRGNLKVLLDAVRADLIPRGTVLIVEAMDRLFREGILDVMPILSDIAKAGMILVTGDLTIWCEAAISGPTNLKLIAEINAAKEYARRLAELAENPAAPRPRLNGHRPGWTAWDPDLRDWTLDETHGATPARIFRLAAAGFSIGQIQEMLLREGVPPIPWAGRTAPRWHRPRIGAILRDRAVMGLFTPHVRDRHDRRHKAGREVLMFPNAIAVEPDLYYAAREVLEGRRTLIGRRGRDIPNSFSRHVRCGTCGGPLRCDTGGGFQPDGKRRRRLVCTAYTEHKQCGDGTRYDLHYFERPLLVALMRLAEVAPRAGADGSVIRAEIAELQKRMDGLSASLTILVPQAALSAALHQQTVAMAEQIDDLDARQADLRERLASAKNASSRRAAPWRFFKGLVQPALLGDVASRERLRSLLAKTDYSITGYRDPVRLVLAVGGRSEEIDGAMPPDGGGAAYLLPYET